MVAALVSKSEYKLMLIPSLRNGQIVSSFFHRPTIIWIIGYRIILALIFSLHYSIGGALDQSLLAKKATSPLTWCRLLKRNSNCVNRQRPLTPRVGNKLSADRFLVL